MITKKDISNHYKKLIYNTLKNEIKDKFFVGAPLKDRDWKDVKGETFRIDFMKDGLSDADGRVIILFPPRSPKKFYRKNNILIKIFLEIKHKKTFTFHKITKFTIYREDILIKLINNEIKDYIYAISTVSKTGYFDSSNACYLVRSVLMQERD